MPTRHSFWQGRHCALTGATGFVGYHLALELVRHGAHVTAMVRDLVKASRLREAGVRCVMAGLDDCAGMTAACTGSDVVFHLAGAVDFEGDWQRFAEVNVEGTRRVLAAARMAGVRRLVHTSSIVAVGGSRRPEILDENAAWNLGLLRVPYITTKRQAEVMALTIDDELPEVVVVNPASVIGPDDFFGSEFGTLCRRFWKQRIPFYFGGGLNIVDVRDVALGHLLAAECGRPGERYLLSGTNRTFGAFFSDLARVAGRSIARMRIPNAVGVVGAELAGKLCPSRRRRPYLSPSQARLLGMYFLFDCSKARREIGYRPRPYRDTLTDTFRFWTGAKAA